MIFLKRAFGIALDGKFRLTILDFAWERWFCEVPHAFLFFAKRNKRVTVEWLDRAIVIRAL